ncbi:hypothetical protein TWF106_011641 [Orbilia oligospora]|uniref:sphinganine-1-phosphate aldolase n=1 Tax=Orbilia oligospora TaxID=2813651 RepID=A0A6G1M7Y4_ORBOL|nr:hypothetical protein TWF788_001498 [Orbilia oligospora]KAF3207622.1 hypothetical protein TWF106_011641 [Orbilia oligospora]KAF3211234.1 hypothetical protein TWF191_010812 [Orbilia oligospora]KAF3223775.1 hypothetical protein TWF679_000213 [Orbilia oligospora]KAF3246379.1 hypothetical protein TWF192_006893 [Orbilia oligospora]
MSSRVPVSLRETFNIQKANPRNQALLFNIGVIRNIVFVYFILRWSSKAARQLRGYGIIGTIVIFYNYLRSTAYGIILRAPGVKGKVKAQLDEATAKLEEKMVVRDPNLVRHLALPKNGISADKIREELAKLADLKHTNWETGQVSGAVYHGGKELLDLQTDCMRLFSVSNPLHPDVFPGVRKMEAEVVAMVLSMFNAPPGGAGVTTSGGTESILMACLSARNKAYVERGVTEPEIIIPKTAHAAFDKAGYYFKMKVHHVEIDPNTYKVDLKRVAKLINYNTVLLVGSAPNFPHGIIDDIQGLSRLALRKKIPLHVDACLGSFIVPFLEKAGFKSEPFDFRLKGVTSISCDTHKYGFAPKGNSTLIYRNSQLRAYQYYINTHWTGGIYASPNLSGSRPGSLIAGCYASMISMGENGYISSAHAIVSCAQRLATGITENLSPDLFVMGEPLVSVVAFTSKTIDIYDLADELSKLGWHLNALQDPPAVHMACTTLTIKSVETLLKDLGEVLVMVKARGKGAAKGDTAALYGVAGSVPNRSVVGSLATAFIDTLFKA